MIDDDAKIFDDLKYNISDGYINLARIGVNVNDKITEELVPDLKYFGWQYDSPIDYDTLKFVLFKPIVKENISSDAEQREEAKKSQYE